MSFHSVNLNSTKLIALHVVSAWPLGAWTISVVEGARVDFSASSLTLFSAAVHISIEVTTSLA